MLESMYLHTPRRYSTSARSMSENSSPSTSIRESPSSASAPFTSPLCARAMASPFSARTCSSVEPVPSTAGSAFPYWPIAASKECSSSSAAARGGIVSAFWRRSAGAALVGAGDTLPPLRGVAGGHPQEDDAVADGGGMREPVDRLGGRARLAAL